MSVRRMLFFLLALCLLAGAAGCEKYGKGLKGRVVAYDPATRQVTFITALPKNWDDPHYLALPPVTMTLPAASAMTGPEPTAGNRVELDMNENRFVLYVPATGTFRRVPFTPVDVRKEVAADDSRLKDPATGQPRKYPLVDKENRTITLYSSRQKVLTTVRVADEELALPASTWEAGDEIRVNYLQEGRMERFTNLSRTGPGTEAAAKQ